MGADLIFKRLGSVANGNGIQTVRSEECDKLGPSDTVGRGWRWQIDQVNNSELIFKVIWSASSHLRKRSGHFSQIGVAEQGGDRNHGRNLDLQGFPGLVFRHTVPDDGVTCGELKTVSHSRRQTLRTYGVASAN